MGDGNDHVASTFWFIITIAIGPPLPLHPESPRCVLVNVCQTTVVRFANLTYSPPDDEPCDICPVCTVRDFDSPAAVSAIVVRSTNRDPGIHRLNIFHRTACYYTTYCYCYRHRVTRNAGLPPRWGGRRLRRA